MTKQQRRRMHRMWNLVNTIFDKHKSIASCYFKRNVIVKREIFSQKMEYWINLELKLDLEKEFIVFVFLFWRILATSAHFSAKENFEWSALKRIDGCSAYSMQFWLSMTLLFPEFLDFILVFRKPLACAFTNFRCYNDRNNIRLKERSKAVMV